MDVVTCRTGGSFYKYCLSTVKHCIKLNLVWKNCVQYQIPYRPTVAGSGWLLLHIDFHAQIHWFISQKENDFSETSSVKLTWAIVGYQHMLHISSMLLESLCYITSVLIYSWSLTMFPGQGEREEREGGRKAGKTERREGGREGRKAGRLIAYAVSVYQKNQYKWSWSLVC